MSERLQSQRAACLQAALRLLARREHGSTELMRKLLQRNFTEDCITTAIDYCQSKNWQNDSKYAEAYTRAGIAKGYGPNKIMGKLLQNGVDKQCIIRHLQFADVDWFELAKEVKLKKCAALELDNFTERQRCQRFLYNRGFDSDMIRYALS